MRISQEASDRKKYLCIPEKMGYLTPKRNSFSDSYRQLGWKDVHFTGSGKTFLSTCVLITNEGMTLSLYKYTSLFPSKGIKAL